MNKHCIYFYLNVTAETQKIIFIVTFDYCYYLNVTTVAPAPPSPCSPFR